MKKFWNLMLAALVIMGAVACTEQDENVDKKPEQVGLSFEATIDFEETRTDVVFNEGKEKWEMAWVGNETLAVKSGLAVYDFKNSVENKNHFVCTDDGVKDLIGQNVEIFLTHDADGSTMNSKAGKAGGNIEATVESFDPAQGVTLAVKSAFLRYASKHEVTLDASTEIFDYDGYLHNSITLPAGEDVWVAIHAAGDVTLECSINGEVRDTRTLNIEAKKIFDLGTLTLPSEPTYIHLVPSNDWKSADAWFSAHFWNESDSTDVTLISYDAEGNIYSCEVPEGMTNVIFCRMNPAYADFAWNSDTEGDHVWNQTADLTVEAAPNNYYYITGWTTGEWNVEGYTPETPEVESIVWSLAGSFNEWGDTLMTSTETANLFVAKGVELKAGDEIKVKDSKTWDTSYGGGITNLEANKWMKAYFNGANIAVAKSGSYDVYFEYAEGAEYSKLYLVDAEGDYTAAVEQTANGTLVPDGGEEPDPDQPEDPTPGAISEYGVVGSFQGWDVAAPVAMYTEGSWVVARGVELYKNDEIKIVKGTSWDGNYGLDAVADLDVDVEHTLKQGGQGNIGCAKNGKFDIYFNAETAKFKYTCAEEYTNLMVNITIDNKAGWNPLYITLKQGDNVIADKADVANGMYQLSGDYIGSSLTYQFFTDGKQTEEANITITKNGAALTVEENVIKLIFKLDTDNSKQWWGETAKIHVWNTGTSFDTIWPGNELTYDGNYTWHIIVPSELVGKTINYLIHNGNGWQSPDSKITISASGNTVTGSSIGIN